MMDNTPLRKDLIGETQIEEILFRAVNLFKKTGLTDLAEKWDKILKMYVGKKDLT
jgi:outer membrane protein assembly factor BamD (BamD/ComL family)